MWSLRKTEVSRTDRVKYEEVLQSFKAEGNIKHVINRRKDKFTGHRFRRNCLIKHIIEGSYKRPEDEEEDVRSYWM
jgi:hypothetical protein